MNIKFDNVMVDLETVDTSINSNIVSIGAVLFNRKEKKICVDTFYRVIDLKSGEELGLSININTILWWFKQSDEARKVFSEQGLPIAEVLHDFYVWIVNFSTGVADIKMWGNSASFDNEILRNAYDKADITTPWSIWNDRCYRTLKNEYPHIKMERIGTYHNALDDAMNQTKHLLEMK